MSTVIAHWVPLCVPCFLGTIYHCRHTHKHANDPSIHLNWVNALKHTHTKKYLEDDAKYKWDLFVIN